MSCSAARTVQWGIALLSALLPTAGNAAEARETVRDLLMATTSYENLATPAGRELLARAVGEYCASIEREYPRNSPAENEWLLGEISGGGDRATRAIGSAEMGRRMAARFTEDCRTWSAALLREPHSARNFTGLAHTFVRFMGDAEYYAPKNGLDPERYAFGVAPRSAVEGLLVAALSAPAR